MCNAKLKAREMVVTSHSNPKSLICRIYFRISLQFDLVLTLIISQQEHELISLPGRGAIRNGRRLVSGLSIKYDVH